MAVGPTCKLCGKGHWSWEPHDWGREGSGSGSSAEPAAPRESSNLPEPAVSTVIVAPTTPTIESKAPSGQPFDRKAYQREYMRKYLPQWRAKKKLKPGGS